MKNKTSILNCIFLVFSLQLSSAYADGRRDLNFDLFEAAKEGKSEQAIDLLEQGASVKARDRFGNSAFLYAVKGGYFDLSKYLIDQGADLNLINTKGENALMFASRSGEFKLANYLVDNGAEINNYSLKNITA